MNNIVWGMIGTGDVTEVKSGPGFYKSEGSILKGVYNRTTEKAHDWAKRHGVDNVYGTVEDMLEDPDIDAVYIAVPPNFHKKYALMALEKGKIPYIEKPLALTYDEGKEILDFAKEVELPVFVAYYRRAMEKYLFIKDIIDSGKLGKVLTCQLWQFMQVEDNELDRDKLHWRVIPEMTLGGKFVDMATHVIDIVQFLFGDIKKVHGISTNNGDYHDVEDTVAAVFKFENGVLGTGNWCYVTDHNDEKLIITGDKGHIETSGLFYDDVKVVIDGKEQVHSFKEPDHVAQPFIQQIVDELLDKNKSNNDEKSSLNNLKVIDKILENYREENY